MRQDHSESRIEQGHSHANARVGQIGVNLSGDSGQLRRALERAKWSLREASLAGRKIFRHPNAIRPHSEVTTPEPICATCGKAIPPGRVGRRCKSCRDGGSVDA